MTLTETAGLDVRAIAWALLREENVARENAAADGADARRDLIREMRPRKKRQYVA